MLLTTQSRCDSVVMEWKITGSKGNSRIHPNTQIYEVFDAEPQRTTEPDLF